MEKSTMSNNQNTGLYIGGEDRVIIISEDIDQASLSDAIYSIHKWIKFDNEMEKNIQNYSKQPIEIIINSYGGNATTGLGFANFISLSPTPVHTYIMTDAVSAAFIILLGGHKRFVYTNTTVMYHQLSSVQMGTMENIKNSTYYLTTLQGKIDNFVISRTELTQKLLNEKNAKSQDWYFTEDELLKYGIATELIGNNSNSDINNSGRKRSKASIL